MAVISSNRAPATNQKLSLPGDSFRAAEHFSQSSFHEAGQHADDVKGGTSQQLEFSNCLLLTRTYCLTTSAVE